MRLDFTNDDEALWARAFADSPTWTARNLRFNRQLDMLDLHHSDGCALHDAQHAPRQETIPMQLFALRRGQRAHIHHRPFRDVICA